MIIDTWCCVAIWYDTDQSTRRCRFRPFSNIVSFLLFWAPFPDVASFFLFLLFFEKKSSFADLADHDNLFLFRKAVFFPPSDYFCFLQNFLPSLPLSLLQAPCLLPQWPRRKDKNIWKLWFIRFAEQTNTFSCSSWPPPVSGLLSSWLTYLWQWP